MGKKQEGTTKKPKRPKVAYVEGDDIELLSLALRVVVEEKKVSTSLIQRRLKIGYSSAARMLDLLEGLAVITPAQGANERKLTGYVPTLKAKPLPPPAKLKVEEKPAAKKNGRPSKYTDPLAREICTRIAYGESVLQICRDDHMPEARTVYTWLLDDDKEDFLKLYDRARQVQAEVFHDEMTDIADNGSNDWMEREVGKGENAMVITVPDHEYINRSKLRVDTRKWMIARMNPKKYGDKLDITSKGKELKQPRGAIINYMVPKEAMPKT